MAASFNLKNFKSMREYLAEMLGTFILMCIGMGSVAQSVLSKGTAGSFLSIYWSWGFGVALGVSASAGVSGGHLNPAVTVTMAVLGRLPWRKVPVFFTGQYCGSFIASMVIYLLYRDALDNFDGGRRHVVGPNATAGIWSTYPQEYVSTWSAFGDQIFGTAMLLIGVLALTDQRHSGPGSHLTPFCVGGLVVAIGMTMGLNCGYAINPARDLAPRIFTAVAGWGKEPFSFRNYNWFWVPIIGPHLGALIGAFVYQVCVGMHWPDEKNTVDHVTAIDKCSTTPEQDKTRQDKSNDIAAVNKSEPSLVNVVHPSGERAELSQMQMYSGEHSL